MTEHGDGSGGAEVQSVRLAVPEMDCPSCAKKVEGSLGRVDGVREAAGRPTTGTATVRFDPGQPSSPATS